MEPRVAYTDRPGVNGDDATPLVFLVEHDPLLRQDLATQLHYNGYRVLAFEQIELALAECKARLPSALIVDLSQPEGDMAMVLAEIQMLNDQTVPIVFLSDRGDIETRLRAVRFGGNAYFQKPFEGGALIRSIDNIIHKHESEVHRILIVEQNPETAKMYSDILTSAGMMTEILNDPLKLFFSLQDFRPDLILMNLYYPECLGMEVAAIVRQEEANQSIPIVYITGETQMEKILPALNKGGDDFLPLPVTADRLVSSVSARIDRSRILRSLLVRDSLTGLLNHTAVRERLTDATIRGKRRDLPFSFAMIDIDKFKRVNDEYGHPVGDQVIQSLARTIRQRIRKMDSAGRYGGEEFAVILEGLDLESAVRAMDRIRRAFSQIRHHSEKGDFYTTFSSGVVSFPDFQDPREMNDAADRALYAAKRSGGNCVARIVRKKSHEA
ncbi:MAG: diguanylate cyclase [Leptospirales bacterium]|nr:diguanylate cyclase [Leptospirales bacterium]